LRPPSLRSQLNQIRLWVRQGRTDAWIAHKLDISVEQLEQFKRDHLSEPEPSAPEPEPVPTAAEEPEILDVEEPGEPEDEEEGEPDEPEPEGAQATERAPRRRRGRRGGRRRSGARPTSSFEATFDHGGEGYGLWLDPAVAENRVYVEHWAGHRAITVTVEPDAITIRRTDSETAAESPEDPEQ
jgi:hypothetical protein